MIETLEILETHRLLSPRHQAVTRSLAPSPLTPPVLLLTLTLTPPLLTPLTHYS